MTDWLNRCHFGDVRDVLRRMIADGVKVNTIITSPPYWGLRSYLPDEHPDKPREIGSERTLGEFLATMVEVFDLARQVLADDGTAWVNMGDSYAGSWGAQGREGGGRVSDLSADQVNAAPKGRRTGALDRVQGLKAKDLIGQPWRLAFALQDGTSRCSACGLSQATSAWPVHNGHRVCADCLIAGNREAKVLPSSPGWWLRSDIIWAKPNPMPESVRDRPTKAHEYLFLLAKSEQYFFDFEGWKEPVSGGAHARKSIEAQGLKRPGFGHGYDEAPKPRYKTPDGWDTSKGQGGHGAFHKGGREKGKYGELTGQDTDGQHRTKANLNRELATMPADRNRRTVWTIPTEAFKGAHFATYPQKLVEPCILAGCPVGGTVLDIFFGSGTTGQVAQRLGRNFIGIDLNPANEPLQRDRIGHQPALMLEVVHA